MSDDKSYTKPKLRARLLAKVKAGAKGGRPGQWSARKAQLLAAAYRAAGGGYRGPKKTNARSLDKWTSEDWTTSDGKPAARKDRKGKRVMKRYLPRAAWEKMTPEQRRATDAKKVAASRKGEQFVANTDKAAKTGRSARAAAAKMLARRSKK